MINQEYLNYLYDKKFEAQKKNDSFEQESEARKNVPQDESVPYGERMLANKKLGEDRVAAQAELNATVENIERYVSLHQIK